jgi:hypothetical protein
LRAPAPFFPALDHRLPGLDVPAVAIGASNDEYSTSRPVASRTTKTTRRPSGANSTSSLKVPVNDVVKLCDGAEPSIGTVCNVQRALRRAFL